MTQEDPRTIVLDVAEFKRGLCDYLRRLQAGEGAFIIRRYREQIAVIKSIERIHLDREANLAHAGFRAYRAAQSRFLAERRAIRGRALRWPPEKFALLRPQTPCERG